MGFSMEIVDETTIKNEIKEQVKPMPEEVMKLKTMTETNVTALMNVNMDSLEERRAILQSIEAFGMDTIQKSSGKNALLQVTVGNLSQAGGEGGMVAKGLVALQREMKDLDPSLIDFTP